MIHDAHVHFFSPHFFGALGGQLKLPEEGRVAAVIDRLGWDDPQSVETLADRWVGELDRHGVDRSALIASVPGDEASVGAAVARYPSRFVGYFMLDPTTDDAVSRAELAFGQGLRVLCLFPAMQRYSLRDPQVHAVVEAAAAETGTAVFVHCGALSVGVRRRLGLPSVFDGGMGHPLGLQQLASKWPSLPFIVPHFGAGLFHETLLVADLCPNIYLDTSSSNRWIRYHSGLTLERVFETAIEVAGPERLLFGTDSSFFPRGWNREVCDRQKAALDAIGASADVQEKIFGGNFGRVFP
jgi:predicted TIM-barrel fold metal-dependent hydrolase